MNPCKASATGLNLKYISSKTDDFSQWPPLAIESSFSYVTNSEKSNKPRNGSPHDRCKSSTTPQNGISTAPSVNGVVHCQYKTVSEGKMKNCSDKDKHGFNSDLLLTGKRLQLSPEFWSADYALRTRSRSDEGPRASSGLHTYPPARTSYINEVNARQSYTNELNARSSYDFDIFSNRQRLPSFCPRPLGQPWAGDTERQKSRAGELRRPLDDVHASGERQPLCTRKRSHPQRFTRAPQLRRISSQDSFGSHIPRTRSASLPVPVKLHDSRVVMEWNEKRNGGVTYVTPVLKTLSEGDLSYSQLKIEGEAVNRKPQQDYFADDA